MPEVTLVEAVNLALAHEMRSDADVVVFGEDVAVNGGVFRATADLLDEFGSRRVFDTPLAEAMIAGLAVGMSTQGIKPVAEIQFMGFIFPALDHLICHAARMRNRTRGRLSCPMVLRVPYGGGIHAPEHHSESTEVLLAHIPGLRVVVPSTPTRAYGLLLAAIRNSDPVVFLEPKRIYRAERQRVEDDGHALPLDSCLTTRQGRDITVVAWGAMMHPVLAAADRLESEDGISTEVIDVATIKPLDMDTILASVEHTGHCVVVHEAPGCFGVGAEISAQISERGFLSLEAPVTRVTGYDVTMPYFKNEDLYLPDVDDVIDAVHRTLKFGARGLGQ